MPEGNCVLHHAAVSLHCQPVAVDASVMRHLASYPQSSLLLPFIPFFPWATLALLPSISQQLCIAAGPFSKSGWMPC